MKRSRGRAGKWLFLSSILVLLPLSLSGQTFNHRGLVVGWANGKFESQVNPQFGFRYIPELTLNYSLTKTFTLDAEFSLNGYGVMQFRSGEDTETDADINPYRLWARFSSSQFELRLGLQKINFGPALMLRSLMWFDSIDPRDPLQLTDGVYALLLRYFAVNNSNIWLWGLFGNDDPKGLELVPTNKDSVEVGGRVQVPAGNGEVAFTYHHRQADYTRSPLPLFFPDDSSIPENRYALDGKWDIGIGLWFEFALIRQHSDELIYPWRRALTIGADYTFDWGNGLNIVGEYFVLESSKGMFENGEGVQFGGMMLNYPLGILDRINCIFFYNFDNNDLYSFINWQRTYDRWTFNVMGFWNPERFQVYPGRLDDNQFTGKGFQLMATFNY